MTKAEPEKIWWTANEIADAKLPDMPKVRQAVQKKIDRENWKVNPDFAKRRAGRGGGWEYHWSLFPMRAQKALLTTVKAASIVPPKSRTELWDWFASLPQSTKDKGQERLEWVQKIEALELGGSSKDLAVNQIAKLAGVSARTLWNWLSMVEGVRADDRLPNLCPRNQAAKRRNTRVEFSDEFWDYLRSDFLRAEAPSFTSCYRRALRIAGVEGWKIAHERTMRRRLEEIPETTIVLARKGVDALKAMYPPQRRDRTAMHALEAVNADYHRFDVFVRWPNEHGEEPDIIRPQLVAFQDVYSGRMLSWRVDRTPNKVGVSLALGDMISRFGIPDHVLLDNGREFANKFLTGGVRTRYRFKVKDDDIPGILKVLGCEVHWATPYSGQSKPIERAFRDFCDNISKDPRFAGAYTGNRPDAKPENYGSRAIDLEEFLVVIAEGIEEHNSRIGRRGQTANGRSFIETFEASYATAPIRKATQEQQRLWLMGAEGLKVDSRTGVVRLMGNEYWAGWLHEYRGQKVAARFDPSDLQAGLRIELLTGEYLGEATCTSKGGFFDLEEARVHSSARGKWVSAEKKAADAQRILRAAELGTLLAKASVPGEEKSTVDAKVVRPTFAKKPDPAKPQKPDPDAARHRASFVADFNNRHKEKTKSDGQSKAQDNFEWALELEARIVAGDSLSNHEKRQLEHYQSTPEYQAKRDMASKFSRGKSGKK